MTDADSLNEIFRSFKETPESIAFDMRLDLASLISRGLRKNDWSQAELARRSGLTPARISNLINAHQNCTLESAVRVLFELGIRARIVDERVLISKYEDPDRPRTGKIYEIGAKKQQYRIINFDESKNAKSFNQTKIAAAHRCWGTAATL